MSQSLNLAGEMTMCMYAAMVHMCVVSFKVPSGLTGGDPIVSHRPEVTDNYNLIYGKWLSNLWTAWLVLLSLFSH